MTQRMGRRSSELDHGCSRTQTIDGACAVRATKELMSARRLRSARYAPCLRLRKAGTGPISISMLRCVHDLENATPVWQGGAKPDKHPVHIWIRAGPPEYVSRHRWRFPAGRPLSFSHLAQGLNRPWHALESCPSPKKTLRPASTDPARAAQRAPSKTAARQAGKPWTFGPRSAALVHVRCNRTCRRLLSRSSVGSGAGRFRPLAEAALSVHAGRAGCSVLGLAHFGFMESRWLWKNDDGDDGDDGDGGSDGDDGGGAMSWYVCNAVVGTAVCNRR